MEVCLSIPNKLINFSTNLSSYIFFLSLIKYQFLCNFSSVARLKISRSEWKKAKNVQIFSVYWNRDFSMQLTSIFTNDSTRALGTHWIFYGTPLQLTESYRWPYIDSIFQRLLSATPSTTSHSVEGFSTLSFYSFKFRNERKTSALILKFITCVKSESDKCVHIKSSLGAQTTTIRTRSRYNH